MLRKQTKTVLLRMPIDLFNLSAHKHRRSNTQELIVAIKNGLKTNLEPIKAPRRLKFGKIISKKELLDAIDEGRE
jgi:hypothetical protein